MTNSPPPNVKLRKNEPGRVLCSGIDSLALAVDAYWMSDDFTETLTVLKEQAKRAQADEPVILTLHDGSRAWLFNVKPHGAGGYEWILESREMTMKIGNWRRLKQRPTVMVDFRAEALWTYGPDDLVGRVVTILRSLDIMIVRIKPSRADLTRDILLPVESWSIGLLQNFVTRAREFVVYLPHRRLSGFTIGAGSMLFRLYDKPLEIKTKSKKFWMYDIWGVPEVPKGHRIIRVEAQMRREVLHSLGCDSWGDFYTKLHLVWAYDTQKWLRLVDDYELHHTQQTILPWWALIGSEFAGMQTGNPLVRVKAIQQDLRQLAAQSVGTLNSMSAIITNDAEIEGEGLLDARAHTDRALRVARGMLRYTDADFTEGVKRKHAKYSRRPASASQKRKNRASLARAMDAEGEQT